MAISEFQYPRPSWRMRAIGLGIVLAVHIGVLLVKTDSPSQPADLLEAMYVIELPIEQPPPEPPQVVDLKLLAPAPPSPPAPEILIEESSGAAPAVINLSPVVVPDVGLSAATGSGDGQATGGSGNGNGSGTSNFAKCTNRVMPGYTSDAKAARIEGKVTLLVQMNETGKFVSISVWSSSGSRSLDAASIAALKRWRCSPVIENGRAVPALVKQEFEFKLQPGNRQASVGDNDSGVSPLSKCTNRVMPDARIARNPVKVTLQVQIDESGKFTSIVVESSSGLPKLDAASISALQQWRCPPVIENGRAVPALVKQEFQFKRD